MTPTRASTTTLLHRLQRGLSDLPIELVYTPHERWPLPHPRIHSTAHLCTQQPSKSQRLGISVLDSSFNPPTLAHLALANSRRPSYKQNAGDGGVHEGNSDYDAKLLLLSVRNADKSLKSTDASYVQRLEMMFLLLKDIHRHGDRGSPSTHSFPGESGLTLEEDANVAVAIIDEPTFVGKSRILLAFLQRRLRSLTLSHLSLSNETLHPTPSEMPTSTQHPIPLPQPHPQLYFLLGFDTLERLFSPRYYASSSLDPTTQMLLSLRKFFSPLPEGDDSRVICARRGPSTSHSTTPTQDQDQESSQTPKNPSLGLAEEFITSQRIVLIDIGEDERTFSSTAVREMIGRGDTGWRRLVPARISEYAEREGIYVGGSESRGK